MSAVRIPVIGIVGGIGSGKSALADALNGHLRCARIDADAAGHRALLRPEVAAALRKIFGDQIFDQDGKIRRSQLARLVFGPGEKQREALKQLEQVVHPYIRRDIIEQLEHHQAEEDCDVIVLDAALLLEAEWSNDCDAIVFLDVPIDLRRARVAERGWTATELARREASQMSLEEKQQRADLIVENSGDLQAAAVEVAEWIKARFDLATAEEDKTSHLSH